MIKTSHPMPDIWTSGMRIFILYNQISFLHFVYLTPVKSSLNDANPVILWLNGGKFVD